MAATWAWVGYDHGIRADRRLVAGTERDGQVSRVHECRSTRGAVEGYSRARGKAHAVDGQILRRCSGGDERRRKSRYDGYRIVNREADGVRGAPAWAWIGHHHRVR